MNLQDKTFTAALTRYKDAATDAAKLHRQVAEQERKVRKLLAIDAMNLVGNNAINPLTNKPHSWTSAVESVKDSDHADELKEAFLELQYTTELAEIETKASWAEILWLVKSDAHQ